MFYKKKISFLLNNFKSIYSYKVINKRYYCIIFKDENNINNKELIIYFIKFFTKHKFEKFNSNQTNDLWDLFNKTFSKQTFYGEYIINIYNENLDLSIFFDLEALTSPLMIIRNNNSPEIYNKHNIITTKDINYLYVVLRETNSINELVIIIEKTF